MQGLQKALSDLQPTASRILVHRDSGRGWGELRLKLRTPTVDGLLGLFLVASDTHWFGRYRCQPAWLLLTRPGSEADALAAGALPDASVQYSRDDLQAARITEAVDPHGELERLLGWLDDERRAEASNISNAA